MCISLHIRSFDVRFLLVSVIYYNTQHISCLTFLQRVQGVKMPSRCTDTGRA